MNVRRMPISILFIVFWASFALAEEREGGIVGTGIAGTITHLGSINVNGQRILIDENMPVFGAVRQKDAGELRPGHTVAAVVRQDGENWRALHIRQVLPLVGPIEAISDGQLTVLGSQVEIAGLQTDVTIGDWVAVSGLWQGQKVLASRLDPVPEASRQARISGTYFGSDPSGRDVVGGTLINGIKTENLQPGDLVRVFGQPTSGGIEATRLETQLFDGAVKVIQVEGYFSEPQPGGLYTVLGSGLIAYTDRPEMIDVESRFVLCGEDGQLSELMIDAAETEGSLLLFGRLGCGP